MKYNFEILRVIILLFSFILVGCGSVSREVIESRKIRDQAFADNLYTVDFSDRESKELIESLRKYKTAIDQSDKTIIEDLLSQDFELQYYIEGIASDKIIMSLQNRSEYLERRSKWSTSAPRGEQLFINIKEYKFNSEKTKAFIYAWTTYKSEYFSPRYNEVMGFKKVDGKWLLNRIIVTPAEPKASEIEVSVISLANISEYKQLQYGDVESRLSAYNSFIDGNGPDAIFDKYIQLSCCLKGDRQSLIIAFSEPPAEGSEVVVRERAIQSSNVYKTLTIFRRSSPYTIFVGRGWYGAHLQVNVEVLVDGVLVGTKIL